MMFLLLFLASCSTCFTIDGKARSSCLATKQFEERCAGHGGIQRFNDGSLNMNNVYATCSDGAKLERIY